MDLCPLGAILIYTQLGALKLVYQPLIHLRLHGRRRCIVMDIRNLDANHIPQYFIWGTRTWTNNLISYHTCPQPVHREAYFTIPSAYIIHGHCHTFEYIGKQLQATHISQSAQVLQQFYYFCFMTCIQTFQGRLKTV